MIEPPILLDCTLRDGGYPIHFQFSTRDVQNIVVGLESSGIDTIEVGHGLGLGASSPQHGVAFENDLDYISIAKSCSKKSKIGAFFVVGIGKKQNIKEAKEYGLDFIRIGVNISDVEQAYPYIDYALSLGLEVHLNLMKSYVYSLLAFSDLVKTLPKFDLTSLYLVDSAGCMTPKEVSIYIEAIVSEGFSAGFHGHNNLDLANANCLSAIDSGAKYIDGTLRGMGRSAGNAQTEILAHLLEKQYSNDNYQVFTLFNTINNHVEPLMISKQGLSSIDVVTGISKFHTR